MKYAYRIRCIMFSKECDSLLYYSVGASGKWPSFDIESRYRFPV